MPSRPPSPVAQAQAQAPLRVGALGVQLTALEVRVSGKVDVRAALGLDSMVPVGFQALRCKVQQTLRVPPPVAISCHWAAAGGDAPPA